MLAGTSQDVDVGELENILKTTDSEQKIAEKIISLLEKDNRLIDAPFFLNRNLLHIVIIKNYTELAKELSKRYPKLVTMPDRVGVTPLHYVAGKHYREAMFSVFFPAFLHLIHYRDNNGRTLLFHAVLEENIAAVQHLINLGANPYIADHKGMNPYALSHNKPIILLALKLLSINQESIKKVFFPLTHRQTDTKALNELTQQFSILKISDNQVPPERGISGISVAGAYYSGRYESQRTAGDSSLRTVSSTSSVEDAIASRSNSLNSPRSESLGDMVQRGDVDGLQEYLEQRGDPNKLTLGRPLIVTVLMTATKSHEMHTDMRLSKTFGDEAMSSDEKVISDAGKSYYQLLFQHQLEQFNLLLKYVQVDIKSKHDRNLLNYIDSKNQIHVFILQQALKSLSEQIKLAVKHDNARLQQLEFQYETRLYQAGLTEFAMMPDTIAPLTEEVNLKTLLWLLCSGIVNNQPGRQFDNVYISNSLQAILTLGPAEKIVKTLNQFWPRFDGQQKLVANYILKELLIWDIHHDLCGNKVFHHDMTIFQENMQRDFTMHGETLNAIIMEILAVKSAAFKNVMLLNYNVISNWLVLPRFSKETLSLEDLIITGAQQIGHVQHERILQVAHEFRALMSFKMRVIRINEFYDKAWSRKDNMEYARHILAQTQATNNLIEFIKLLILNSKTSKEVTNTIRFLILVAAQLCSPEGELGPDMASIIIISGALNSAVVSRLKDNFSQLEPEIQEVWSKLNELTSSRLNSKWLRAVESGCHIPIPHLGLILTDVTFAYDGNRLEEGNTIANVMPFLGPKLKSILQLQRQLLQSPSYLLTDICFIARAKISINEDEQYDKSYQFLSPRIDISDLTFDELMVGVRVSNDKHIIPRYTLNKMEYSKEDAIKPILFKITDLIAQMPPKVRASAIDLAKNDITAFCELIIAKHGPLSVDVDSYCKQLETMVVDDNNLIREFKNFIQHESKSIREIRNQIENIAKSTSDTARTRECDNNLEYSRSESIKGVFFQIKRLIEKMAPGSRKSALLPARGLFLSLTKLINLQNESHKVNYVYYHKQLKLLYASPYITPALKLWQQTSSSTQVTEGSEDGKRKLKLPFQSLF